MRNQEHYEDMLPEDAMPMFGVRILAYYGKDGQMAYKVSNDENGTTPITSFIGLLEMVKIDIASNANMLGRKMLEEEE